MNTYVLTLWRPTMKATFLLQGLIKEDQEVSMVRYSPFRAHIRKGECSNGCPANWRTERESESCALPLSLKKRNGQRLERGRDSDSLFLWMATIMGLSSGWRYSRTGVPTRSWGRYPNRGTARSSTSWKRQLGVWLVVNILLSRGMRGAERGNERKWCYFSIKFFQNVVKNGFFFNQKCTLISRVHSLCDEQTAGLRVSHVRVSEREQVGGQSERVVLHITTRWDVSTDATKHGLLLGAVRWWRD